MNLSRYWTKSKSANRASCAPIRHCPCHGKFGIALRRLLIGGFCDQLGDDQGYKDSNWRWAVLMHIACMHLNDLNTVLEKNNRVPALKERLQKQQPMWEGSLGMLHLLVAKSQAEVRLENPETTWKVARLLGVAQRLTRLWQTRA